MKEKILEIQQEFSGSLSTWNDILWQFKVGCDSNNIVPDKYTSEDVLNATHLFSEVIGNVHIHRLMEKKSKLETGCGLSEDMGKELRKFVKTWTGVDLHDNI